MQNYPLSLFFNFAKFLYKKFIGEPEMAKNKSNTRVRKLNIIGPFSKKIFNLENIFILLIPKKLLTKNISYFFLILVIKMT